MRRLKATFINQVDAHEGVGGSANSVDLVRADAGRVWRKGNGYYECRTVTRNRQCGGLMLAGVGARVPV